MINDCTRNLSSLRSMLEGISNDEYAQSLPILFQASVGQHVRHVLEFYICMIQGIPTGKVNYDQRERDLRLETEVSYAKAIIDSIVASIEGLNPSRALFLVGDSGVQDVCPFEISTNVERELAYNLEHSIHHQALIKIGLSELNRLDLIDAEFGVAPSTLRQRNTEHNTQK